MKRPTRHSDGKYHIKGRSYKELFGSRQQVWNKTAFKTAGELERKDLIMNKRGRIVSKSKSIKTKKENGSRFKKAGYRLTRKGEGFGKQKLSKTAKKSRRKTARKGRK
tara:strand:+ start:136 stop:459 length:324 start_codon:yes stop_codon:yes gene_type:complete